MASSIQSLSSGFFPSNNLDRLYTADQFANLFDCIISNGVFISSSKDDKTIPFSVSFNGSDQQAVVIQRGVAWLNDTWTVNNAEASLSMYDAIAIKGGVRTETGGSQANNNNPRWDAIAIEVNKSFNVRANTFVVVEGTASSEPTKPNVSDWNNTESGIYYYALAYVYRPKGSSYSLKDLGSDKLEIVVGKPQNGGVPLVTSIAGKEVALDDLMATWDDGVKAKLDDLQRAINEVQATQVASNAIATKHLQNGSVTGQKIYGYLTGQTEPEYKIKTVNVDTNEIATLNSNRKIKPANLASAMYAATSSEFSFDYSTYSCSTLLCKYGSNTTVKVLSNDELRAAGHTPGGWDLGAELEIIRMTQSEVTVQATGGAKFHIPSIGANQTSFKIANNYGTVVLKMVEANIWVVAGDVG